MRVTGLAKPFGTVVQRLKHWATTAPLKPYQDIAKKDDHLKVWSYSKSEGMLLEISSAGTTACSPGHNCSSTLQHRYLENIHRKHKSYRPGWVSWTRCLLHPECGLASVCTVMEHWLTVSRVTGSVRVFPPLCTSPLLTSYHSYHTKPHTSLLRCNMYIHCTDNDVEKHAEH